MQQANILYIGRSAEIKDIVVRLINNKEEWKATGVLTDNEAKTAWESASFDIVLLGSGIEPECETGLRHFFTGQKQDIIIIQHYGGGSGLLYNEIFEALNKFQHPEVS
jgi:hypothetical protein